MWTQDMEQAGAQAVGAGEWTDDGAQVTGRVTLNADNFPGEGMRALLAEYDRDSDGVLSKEEREAAPS